MPVPDVSPHCQFNRARLISLRLESWPTFLSASSDTAGPYIHGWKWRL